MTSEPWYPIPPDPPEPDECGGGNLCDCHDPAEDVVLAESENRPRDERTSGATTTGGVS